MSAGRVIALIACAAASFGAFFAIGHATADDEPAPAPAEPALRTVPRVDIAGLDTARRLPLLRVASAAEAEEADEPAAPANPTPPPANPSPTPAPAPAPTPAPTPTPAPAPTPAPDTGENFDDSG